MSQNDACRDLHQPSLSRELCWLGAPPEHSKPRHPFEVLRLDDNWRIRGKYLEALVSTGLRWGGTLRAAEGARSINQDRGWLVKEAWAANRWNEWCIAAVMLGHVRRGIQVQGA